MWCPLHPCKERGCGSSALPSQASALLCPPQAVLLYGQRGLLGVCTPLYHEVFPMQSARRLSNPINFPFVGWKEELPQEGSSTARSGGGKQHETAKKPHGKSSTWTYCYTRAWMPGCMC